jgi:hypothetical protein
MKWYDRSVPLDRPFGGAKVIDLHQRHDLPVVTNLSIGVLIAQGSRCDPPQRLFPILRFGKLAADRVSNHLDNA